tara:strand:- start:300 stop:770 length:471 start_codon:yes stop_codon:yes gene_type:complete
MRLSSNFTANEMCRSNTALRMGVANDPSPEELRCLGLLCTHVLQRLRNKLGAIRVNSAYRNKIINRAIKGSRNSQHIKGQAADIVLIRDGKMDNRLIFDAVIELDLDFDQMIWEFGGQWIHISYDENRNRKQILEAYKDENNKTKYRKYPPKYIGL